MTITNTEAVSDADLIARLTRLAHAPTIAPSSVYANICGEAARALSRRSANSAAGGVEVKADEEDLASDDRWNAGVNYAIERLCEILGVDPKAVNWDAATETLDGDVMSVICNVLVAAYGEEWSSNERDTAIIRSALASIPATGGEKPVASPPAQEAVTDAMVERAQDAYREAGEKRNWQHSWPDAESMREILTAALQLGKEG